MFIFKAGIDISSPAILFAHLKCVEKWGCPSFLQTEQMTPTIMKFSIPSHGIDVSSPQWNLFLTRNRFRGIDAKKRIKSGAQKIGLGSTNHGTVQQKSPFQSLNLAGYWLSELL
jgi:hypothetical protein